MFARIAAFEWRYQVRSPVFWVGIAIFFLLTFGAATVEQIQIGARGNVHINSPFNILQVLTIMGLFASFVTVAMVAGTVLRDDETGAAALIRSTRVTKRDYLFGRFVGAVAAAFLVLACIPLAIFLGSLMPWQDPEKIGPFVAWHYVGPLLLFALPTLLITGAAFFALATATRSMMWTYVGLVGMLVLYLGMRAALRDPRHDAYAALLDPFGMSPVGIATRYWTAAERNTQLPPMEGALLHNRLLWTAVAVALLALTYKLFRFDGGRGDRALKSAPQASIELDVAAMPARAHGPVERAVPRLHADQDSTGRRPGLRRAQLIALARHDMAFVFRSPAFFVLLGIGLINAGASMWFGGELYGSPSYPVTRLMVDALNGAFNIIPVIVAIYYGGELVWRDRERRVHEMVDATPAPDWMHLAPKILAIALVLVATALVGTLAGIAIQSIRGYFDFDLAAYALWFVLPTSIGALLLAVLSVTVQVLVPQKALGWGAMLLFLVASVALAGAGFEHNLYQYGSTPAVPLSDMNRMGRFWVGAAWFQAYWLAFAVLLVLLAYGLWRRGATLGLAARWPQLRRRLHGGWALAAGAAAVAWVGLGGWIFYNTNILNRYITVDDFERLQARAERELLKFEDLPQPKIAEVALDVQVHPGEARIQTSGRYTLVNRSAGPLAAVHVFMDPRTRLDKVEIEGGARIEREWKEFNYRIYQLATPMQPGESRRLEFGTTLQQRGFVNSQPLTRVVDNGSFVDNTQISPFIGLSRDGLLRDRAKRRKHGLPPDLRPPTLEDEAGRSSSAFRRDSDWVTAEIRVTTDADQTPIAPGATVSDTVSGSRRTAVFKPESPIQHFFSIQSARYAVKRDVWKGPQGDVALAVYHHPDHAWNVERMLAAKKLSLAVFTEVFSPYQFNQARILEFPAYASFAQSFANTIPYSEAIGFVHRWSDPEKIDMVTYVTAHEIGHQWWGHQLVPSRQQGGTMLVESFAQYSALLVMERLYGPEQIRKFLKYELDRYLRSRGGEAVEELPLARVENQPYIHYQKGSLAMWWIREMAGEAAVNRAMARFLKAYAFKAAPYPNTRDFLKLLREEAGPRHDGLIDDLFERIVLLDLKAAGARKLQRADGQWELTLDIEARKLQADGKGKETELPLDEPVEVGAFTEEPGRKDFKAASVLRLERFAIRSGRQQVKLVLPREPHWAGVDPYNKRIDRNSADNLIAVGKAQ